MPAPKKKSATTKADASKKASNASVSRNKKSTVKKKPKPKTSKESVASKSNTVKSKVKSPFFSWAQWNETFHQSLICWKSIILRYSLILFLTLGLNLLGVFTMATTLLSVFGGVTGLESILANLRIGTLPEPRVMALSLLIFMFWLGYATYINVLSKIAVFALIKNHLAGKKESVMTLFFQTGNQFCLRYIGLSLRVFFYVVWPVLAFFALVTAWQIYLSVASVQGWSAESFIPFVSIAMVLLAIAAFGSLIYAVVRVLFAQPLLIQTGNTVGETFQLAKKITAGRWWFTFLMWGLFVGLLYAVNVVIAQIAYLDPIVLIEATEPSDSLRLTDLLAFFMSLFIFGPITSAFLYLLMLRGAKNQSVKI